MISVDEALEKIFELVTPVPTETVPLRVAAGRILAEPVVATRDQPPFRSAVMDGYAIASLPDTRHYRIIGEAAAGHAWGAAIAPGEAVRIFTGAPVPDGADRVVMQEDTVRDGDELLLSEAADTSPYIRDIGCDFRSGASISAPRLISPSDLALFAAMNVAYVTVRRKPVVALFSTGDELVMPGEDPGPSQIIASNHFGLAAIAEAEGAEVRMLPIARDTREALESAFARAAGADLIVSIGGASVGDFDLVGGVAAGLGMERAFYKVAMRPGKPLMAGRLGGSAVIGLPGNPVSSMACGHIFMRPAIRAMLGLAPGHLPLRRAPLAAAVPANGPRQHYMRAVFDGTHVSVAERQDSSLLSVLASANALVVRPPHDAARAQGESVSFIKI